jgi:hypothetical protein
MILDLKRILTEAADDVEVQDLDGSVNEVLEAIRVVASIVSILELFTVTPFAVLLGPGSDAAER